MEYAAHAPANEVIAHGAGDAHGLVRLAIRCLPRAPVPTEDLEHWIEEELADLRQWAPEGTIRLSRLTQELPNLEVGIGWLIEFELPEDQPLLGRDQLSSVLRDLRLLGLQPTVLVPSARSGWPAHTALLDTP